MKSFLEVLPTEIWFDIFDYLTTFDIFHGFINLNKRINDFIGFYPLKLDFQRITRSEFDLICRSLQSKQVLSLFLSDELMPDQVQLFHQYFPHFHKEFIHLKTLKYLDTSTILPHIPRSLSSLSIKTYFKHIETDPLIIQILNHQSDCLTSLQIDGSYVFRSITHSFPLLTHLIIDYCTTKEFHQILRSLQSPLTHLKVFLDQPESISLPPNFGRLSNTLIDLSLTFSEEIVMSFESIKQWLTPLFRLTCLTLQTICTFDMLNGESWENYLLERKIEKFHFKFILGNKFLCPEEDQDSLLQSFRSSYWMNKTNWYVVCEKGQLKSSRPILYSIPYFQPTCIFYPSNHFLSKSTNEKETFISKHRIYLILTFHQTIPLPKISFNNVYSLALITSTLPSIETLQSIVNLKQIRQLDVALVQSLSIDHFRILIDYMSNLKMIRMQFNPFYIPPLHIHSYIFVREDQNTSVIDWNNIDRFSYLFFHIKYLEITIQLKEIIIQLLNRLHYLETVRIYSYQNYLENIKSRWFRENIPRLKTLNFTYRVTTTCLVLSIGDRIAVNTETNCEQTTCLKLCSPCKLQ